RQLAIGVNLSQTIAIQTQRTLRSQRKRRAIFANLLLRIPFLDKNFMFQLGNLIKNLCATLRPLRLCVKERLG
ncbi:hypothetical protein L0Z72_14235, partial [candidate division KSB1 bacterium]|nr:hypothetical protein [candidate division KSB1 bacterium]